ncbi:AAA family ATPase [Photobacterium piscicola]|uniref:AAA family ATPase n=1 Tax=Photobacterium piscicola TaxID=1378299 RepID=UPI002E18F41C|nr:AAA family ATPase [Photobacterium piscicola]
MELSIENFGLIVQGSVKVDGLTVIAGQNDSGKSTVGKIFFSLVKAISRYKDDLEEDKNIKLKYIIQRNYLSLRRQVNLSEYDKLKELFHPDYFLKDVLLNHNSINERRSYIDSTSEIELKNDVKKFIHRKLDSIEKILIEPTDKKSVINKAIVKVLYSEFKGELYPLGRDVIGDSIISIKDGASKVLDIKFDVNGVTCINFYDDLGLGYQDATFVDSPTIIQYHDLIEISNTVWDEDSSVFSVPLHIKDLSNKLKRSVFNIDLFSKLDSLNNLSDIYKGQLQYNKDKADFILDRGTHKVSSSNVATGIKSLGILDLLIESGLCGQDNLLILDEPEVHLHPKWQITYAKTICDLVQQGANIIVTTHSPYMLEALNGYSRINELDSNFYTTVIRDNGVEFIDVSNNIEPVINDLAAPIFELHEELMSGF